MTREELDEWIRQRSAKDDQLYERHGKPLEEDHKGEWIAIGDNGEWFLGQDRVELSFEAFERFGSGNYALRRIGYPYNIRMRLRPSRR
jgi:hypothetical protein